LTFIEHRKFGAIYWVALMVLTFVLTWRLFTTATHVWENFQLDGQNTIGEASKVILPVG